MTLKSTSGGWQKTISVHPHNPDVVAFGWKKALLSIRGGNGWRALGGRWINPGEWQYNADMTLHDDVHAVCFDPVRDRRLYVLSDGGSSRICSSIAQDHHASSGEPSEVHHLRQLPAEECRTTATSVRPLIQSRDLGAKRRAATAAGSPASGTRADSS